MSVIHGGVRRRALSLLSAVVVVAGLATVPAQPATAANYTALRPTTWAYTDSRTPVKSYVGAGADAPIGAWLDDKGRKHRSRSYFTYDIGQFRGKRIISAIFSAQETDAEDCTAARTWELWRTDRIRPNTSWANPPRARAKIASIGGEGCGSWVEADLADTIRAALARNETTLTVELRAPARVEGNPRYGRRIRNNPAIVTDFNTPPGTPSDLKVDGRNCSGTGDLYISNPTPYLNATLTDPDRNETGGGNTAYSTFAIWPVDRPNERWESPESWAGYTPTVAWGYTPANLLQNGVTYAFAVRSRDTDDVSPWSAECRFTLDTERPTQLPTVTSAAYPNDWQPHGGPGIAGDFTFSANGATDVVGFRYGLSGAYQYVMADAPGGSATVQITPTHAWLQFLTVASVDRAGLSSDSVQYEFFVKDTAPGIQDTNPDAWLGDPRTIVFKPGMDDTVSYTYQLDDGAETTVPAGPDGTARITVTPPADGLSIHLRSTDAAGRTSDTTWLQIRVRTEPVVETTDFKNGPGSVPVGTPGTFTIKPFMHGVVEYVYQFDRYDDPTEHIVAAGPDGTATVQFTAADVARHTLHVWSRTADGVESAPAETAFNASSIAPKVTSAEYPEWTTRGGPGVEGSFTFTPTATGVVEYEYKFGQEPVQTIAATSPTTVRWTPLDYDSTWYGEVMLTVRSRSGNGLVSDWNYYRFRIQALEPLVTADRDTVQLGEQVTLTFTAQLPGTTEFRYTVGSSAEQTVAAGPDGRATVQWTMTEPYSAFVNVYSRTAAGAKSGDGYTVVYVQS